MSELRKYRRRALDVEAKFSELNQVYDIKELGFRMRDDFRRDFDPICPRCNGIGTIEDHYVPLGTGYIKCPDCRGGILPWPSDETIPLSAFCGDQKGKIRGE